MIAGSVENPELLKMYAYFGDKGLEELKEFRKANLDRINDLRGKVQAKKVVEELQEADSPSKVAAILNNTKMAFFSVEQASLETAMGYAQHVFNFLEMINPDWNFGSVKTFDEYKFSYILMAISDMETKESLGLIEKDKNGNYVSTNPNSLIDYGTDLAGSKNMVQVYNTSKAIWKLIPMIILRKNLGTEESIKVLGQDVKFMNIIQSVLSGGEKSRDLRLSGMSVEKSTVGGMYKTFSDLLMNKFLGGIQMFGDVKVDSVKTYIEAALKEGGKSPAKCIADSLFEWTILGVEPPNTKEEWIAYANKLKDKSIQGIILALIANAGWGEESTTISKTTKEVSKKVASENTNDLIDGTKEMVKDTVYGSKYILKQLSGIIAPLSASKSILESVSAREYISEKVITNINYFQIDYLSEYS